MARTTVAPTTIDVIIDKDAELARIERIAQILDSEFVIPGTEVRFGLDSLVGLIPGIGDIIGFIASLYVVWRLDKLGISGWTRFRMYWNVVIDFLAGVFPVVGDVFDVAFKANLKNVELARRYLGRQRKRLR